MVNFAYYSFITLLVMVNPIEAAAAFDTLTAGDAAQRQRAIAWRATIAGLVILLVFGFAGDLILRSLGVSFPAFRIAGGILLFKVGANMVFAQQTQTDEASTPANQQRPDPSIFPLAIPIITGPGALTASVTLFAKTHEQPDHLVAIAMLVGLACVVFAITYVTMRGSQSLTALLGETGVDAIGRIMGIIVAAIAVQLIVEGAQQLMPSIVRLVAPG
ncbi:MAG: MarC family protein [Candidatus Eremiobacteraeota bacterium]|nr:MarC family protein [Candidatus Eremiobacteraeota bacterium]